MDDDLIEKWAIRLALGNNGGTWAEHYTDGQKTRWRTMARELLEDARREVETGPWGQGQRTKV